MSRLIWLAVRITVAVALVVVTCGFFTALARDYAAMVPASAIARMLVGMHLILSVGWALVLFAAVMTSIEPKLARIARQHEAKDDD